MDIITIILGLFQLIATGAVIFMYIKDKKSQEKLLEENTIKDGDKVQLYTQFYNSNPNNFIMGYQDGTLKLMVDNSTNSTSTNLNEDETYFQINFNTPSLNNTSKVTLKHIKTNKYLTVDCETNSVYLNDSNVDCTGKKCSTFVISLNNDTAKIDEKITSSSVIRLYVSSSQSDCQGQSNEGKIVIGGDNNSILLQDADCLKKIKEDQNDTCKDNKSLVWLFQKVKESSTSK
jgi:hypothetical protein